ncbi:basement membrane-specific heparan sulfate proteoglycan core protein-like isoform X2 [Channa argus]|uniref:basement membrane-specific heparan sulfate proteoglycan core protein-like isoform X2 n=1 Tax=Channa argus TaxID=215402 RepID=UPI003522DDDA
MGHTLFCVLSLFLLSALIHGNAEEPGSKATLTADKTTIPVGGNVTLSCSVDGSDDWTFYFYRKMSDSSQPQTMNNNGPWSGTIGPSEGGLYFCRGGRGDPLIFTSNSSELRIKKTAASASLTLHQTWNQIFSGESITLTCNVQGGGGTEWTYEWTPAKLNTRPTHNEHVIDRATESDSGNYRCRGKKDFSLTEWSNVLTLTISADKPKPTLTADKKTIRAGESVTLTCSVDGSDGWKFYWYRRLSDSSGHENMNNNGPWDRVSVISEVGLHSCRGGRGDPLFITDFSNEVRIEKIAASASLTLQQNWNQIFSGESITLTCDIQGGGGTEWTYEWTPAKLNTPPTQNKHVIDRATESDSGNYWCRGKKDFSLTEWSNVLTLTISADKPKPTLTADKKTIRAGERVTLTCSVDGSDGWKFYWYRRLSDSSGHENMNNNGPWDRVSVISEVGLYSCRGGRGDPLFFTEFSNEVRIEKIVVSRRPSWSPIYSGEKITVTCQIEGGTEWTYEWTPAKLNTRPTHNEHVIDRATESDSGNYRCRGKKDNYFTEWSNVLTLTISADKPKPTLTADKTTIQAGERVTLTCSVDRWVGWTFYWYRRLSDSSGREDMNNNGPWYRVRVISEGGLYSCRGGRGGRGGRGDPLFFTKFSNEVRIEKIAASASLTLQQNWNQIFSGESITLTCDIQGGGGTEWTYEWTPAKLNTPPTQNKHVIDRATESDSGNYRCRGKKDNYFTEWSNVLTLTISADKPKPTLTADKKTIRAGERVTLTCSVDRWDGWTFYWYRRLSDSSGREDMNNNGPWDRVSVISEVGLYSCRGGRGGRGDPLFFTEFSNEVRIEKIVVSRRPSWSPIYSGEKITVTCQIEGGTEWTYEWTPAKLNTRPTHNEHVIDRATESDSGNYRCRGKKDNYFTEWSNVLTLTISADKPKPTLTADKTTIQAGERVTLTCSVDRWVGWTFYWYRRLSDSSGREDMNNNGPWYRVRVISEGGLYSCRGGRGGRGGRGDPLFFTKFSNEVRIEKIVPTKVTVSRRPSWSHIYRGEKITVTCQIEGGTEWTYEWTPAKLNTPPTHNEHVIDRATESDSGNYWCRGKKDFSLTEWSNVLTLTISAKPKAHLRADSSDIPVGGSVTLTCSVKTSSGWKYFWYRGDKSSDPLITQDAVSYSSDRISVSQEGLYWCRGGRGNPVYYTEYSDSVRINKNVPNKATVTLQHTWSQIFTDETITLTCEITDRGDTEWEYEWRTPRSMKPPEQKEYEIRRVTSSHRGEYSCRARMKTAQQSSTDWSDVFTLTVSDKPQPVLTVSPSWLSPGASVTLNCEVEHPSAGWRFYWYKTVPDLSDKYYRYYRYYRYELLPGRDNGTEQNSSIIHGQTHTAGYVCRAGRGDPVYYTHPSEPKFVWSGDVRPSASLTVNPDRVQHFTSDSVSLSCEGNSTEWTVRRFTDGGFLSHCYHWGTMTGSTCKISTSQSGTAVYWCESGSGEFSNAVNITVQHQFDIMLVSPVLPVTEGTSVTLGCKFKKENVLSQVFFYKNDKLIQNDTRVELSIFAVSKSDEGVYKCKIKKNSQLWTSPQSWMSVKLVSAAESSSFPVPLIVGLVCGVLLIILLLPLCCYRKIKDSRFLRSHSTNQSSATDHMINLSCQDRKHALPGDVCLYESIKDPEGTEYDDSRDVTYSSIELKNITNDDDTLMYTDVHFLNKGKAKKNKGTSSPAVADATIYSEVQPQITLGNNAEIK